MIKKFSTLFVCVIALSLTLPAWANQIWLPSTGQTTCYDEDGTEIECAGTGQDAEIQAGAPWPDPRFTDHGDGTATDNLTGLMWLTDTNCANTSEYDPSGTGDGSITWQEAFDFANGINGQSIDISACTSISYLDWRIPNQFELSSLGTLDTFIPAIPNNPFINIQNSYHTSNTYTYDSSTYTYTKYVSFSDAATTDILPKENTAHAWLVRLGQTNTPDPFYPGNIIKTGQTLCYDTAGNILDDCAGTGHDGEYQSGVEWPSPRFTDNQDDTITDNLTGLTWMADESCMTTHHPEFDTYSTEGDGKVTFQQAIEFINGINEDTYPNCQAGSTDWRLPNIRELESLMNLETNPISWRNDNGFTPTPSEYKHWSSSMNPLGQVLAVTSARNSIDIYSPNYFKGLFVWPVRDGIPDINIGENSYNFQSVKVGTDDDFSDSITNEGSRGTLEIGTLEISGVNTDQFTIEPKDCKGASLTPGESCNYTILFEPSSEGAKTASLIVTSNDWNEPTVQMNLSGNGSNPDITITDSDLPSNDLIINFGSIAKNTSMTGSVTISNNGTSLLSLGNIAISGDHAEHFVLTNDCLAQGVEPENSCSFDITFSPVNTGIFSATLSIDSNDPDITTTEITLNGTGLSEEEESSGPAPFELISPTDGQTGLDTTVTFTWNTTTDSNDETVSYDFYYGEDASLSNSSPIEIAALGNIGVRKHLSDKQPLEFIIAGFLLTGLLGLQKEKRLMIILLALLAIAPVMISCGGNGGGSTVGAPTPESDALTNQVSYTITDLKPATTYYWKVTATNESGLSTSSDTMSFTTK